MVEKNNVIEEGLVADVRDKLDKMPCFADNMYVFVAVPLWYYISL